MEAAIALVHADCVLCGANDPEPAAVGADFERPVRDQTYLMVRCRLCSQLYLNPRPAAVEAEPFEPPLPGRPGGGWRLARRLRQGLEARRIVRWCRTLPAQARVLEVGCGRGERLAALRRSGRRPYRLEGADADVHAVAEARARGLTVHAGAFEALALQAGSYDLVFTMHTLEYALEPPAFLAQLGRALRPGGRLIVVTSNAASLDKRLFGRRHYGGYGFPRRRCVFTRETLARAAALAGVRVVTIAPLVSPLDWARSIRNVLLDLRAPRALLDRFAAPGPATLVPLALLDALGPLAGRALLCATFERPAA